jgi:hypothetical protein
MDDAPSDSNAVAPAPAASLKRKLAKYSRILPIERTHLATAAFWRLTPPDQKLALSGKPPNLPSSVHCEAVKALQKLPPFSEWNYARVYAAVKTWFKNVYERDGDTRDAKRRHRDECSLESKDLKFLKSMLVDERWVDPNLNERKFSNFNQMAEYYTQQLQQPETSLALKEKAAEHLQDFEVFTDQMLMWSPRQAALNDKAKRDKWLTWVVKMYQCDSDPELWSECAVGDVL